MPPLLVGGRCTVDLDGRGRRPSARAAGAGAQERGEALRRRRPPEREQAQRPVRGRRAVRAANCATSIPWPIPTHLRVVDRIRAAVDAEPDVGERGRELQRPVDRPVRVPEQPAARGRASPAAQRGRGRSGTCARSRASGRGRREQLRHERAHVAEATAELRPRAEGPQGAVRRQVVRSRCGR